MLGISHYLACRSSLAKHFIICYLWPLTVGSYLDLHTHNEKQLVMIEFKLSRSVMIESNLSRSECVVLQIPHSRHASLCMPFPCNMFCLILDQVPYCQHLSSIYDISDAHIGKYDRPGLMGNQEEDCGDDEYEDNNNEIMEVMTMGTLRP